MIKDESLIRVDWAIIKFGQSIMQEHQIDNQVWLANGIWISGRNLVSWNWQIQVEGVSYDNKIVTNRRVMRKRRIPDTVLNIKIASHNKKVLNLCLRILKIFQGRVRRIWINVHDPKIDIIVKERNKKNIFVTNNVFVKWKLKRWKSDINIYDDSRGVICWVRFSSKSKPIWVIWNVYQRNTFTVL